MTEIFFLLILLQIKHWYCDFVIQTQTEIDHKGIYGDYKGIMHSVKHGFGTLICVMIPGGSNFVIAGLLLGLFDGIIHYHIDWVKMNYGNNNIKEKQFWCDFGLDQMAHQITYLTIGLILS